MPTVEISLDGPWLLTGTDRGGHPLEIPGQVPGYVHLDLLAAGVIDDPFWRDQAEACQWIEERDWTYSRTFEAPDTPEGAWWALAFGGLDTYATVLLNDRPLGDTDNMFIPHWFEATRWLQPGKNRIEVRFRSTVQTLRGRPTEAYPAFSDPARVHVRRMQHTFGWDIVQRFIGAGIWQPVRLRAYTLARVADLHVRTLSCSEERARLGVSFEIERRSRDPLAAHVEIFDPEGRRVRSCMMDLIGDHHKQEIQLDQPALWWPNGHGRQPIYACSVTLFRPEGPPLERRETTFGIRKVELIENPDQRGSSVTLLVNGRRIFAKGANWVPASPFPGGVSAGHYERLVGLAHDAGVNMLRGWGGGCYESEPFWDACDRAGILVMQDFMLACARYPEEDPAFLDALRREFRTIIVQLRNHPSLALWSGNNELGMNQSPEEDYWGKRIAAEVSGPLCATLDPDRPFRPSSPWGGKINNDPNHGDHHCNVFDHSQRIIAGDFRHYRQWIQEVSGRFVTEYVVVGSPPLRSLLKFMTPDDIVASDLAMWEYHTKDNPYLGGTEWSLHRLLRRLSEGLYGANDDPQARIRHMEYIEYEWTRLAGENLRRLQADCGGILYWMFNDTWPASVCSLVDHYGFAKAGYYAMRCVFRPVIVALEEQDGRLWVWVCNDRPEPVTLRLTLTQQPWTGAPLSQRVVEATVPGSASVKVTEVRPEEISAHGMFVCDLTCDSNTDRATYFPGLPSEMALPSALLRVCQEGGPREGTLTVSTHCYARVVSLDADLDFSDNYFDLLPGESRTITWSSPGKDFSGAIPAGCWNGKAGP